MNGLTDLLPHPGNPEIEQQKVVVF